MSDLYGDDILLWSERQAELLRRMAAGERVNDQVDWENVAEEIESVGRSQEQELANRVLTVLDHLLRLQASPAVDPRRGWRSTIVRSRAEIDRLLKRNRTLRESLATVIAEEMPTAREIAALALAEYGETPTVPLDQLTCTTEQVLGRWLPEVQ
jgi:hypothetical protein